MQKKYLIYFLNHYFLEESFDERCQEVTNKVITMYKDGRIRAYQANARRLYALSNRMSSKKKLPRSIAAKGNRYQMQQNRKAVTKI